MGRCEYILARDTGNRFVVLAKNKPCGDLQRTCVYTVAVIVKGLEIKLLRGGLVQVSGKYIHLPYINQGKLVVFYHFELFSLISRKERYISSFPRSLTLQPLHNYVMTPT